MSPGVRSPKGWSGWRRARRADRGLRRCWSRTCARRTMNSPAPFNWEVPAGRALEAALNRALALDPDTREGLAALDGRSIELAVEAPPLALRVTVAGDR